MRENWVDDVRLGLRIDISGYYAAITFIDDEVGRLLDALEETGKAENTIVLLTSDHGDMLGSHGTNLKRKPWQESVQAPGFLRYPAAVESNQKTDLLASHVDVVPTLLGLAGVESEVEMDGRDLSPHLFSAEHGGQVEAQVPESVYLQSYTATEATSMSHGEAFEPSDTPTRGMPTGRGCFMTTRLTPINATTWLGSRNMPSLKIASRR